MSEARKNGHLKPVPGREGTYSYEPKKQTPSFDEILHRISTPVVIERDKGKKSG